MYGFALPLMHLTLYAGKNPEPPKYKGNVLAWRSQNKSACYLSLSLQDVPKDNLRFYGSNIF